MLALVHAHLESEGSDDVEVTVLGSPEAAVTPIEHPFVQRVARIAEEVTGQRASITPIVGWTLPIIASLQRPLGVPGLAAPDNPFYFDYPFHFGARAYAPNEHVRLEDLGYAARFSSTLFEDLASAG